ATSVVCPDCAESAPPDENGCCAVCGHEFNAGMQIDEEEFFRAPPSLDEALERERRRVATLAGETPGGDTTGLGQTPAGLSVPQPQAYYGTAPAQPFGTRPAAQPAPRAPAPTPPPRSPKDLPLPSERSKTRFRGGDTGAQAAVSQESETWLIVEGGQTVFFDGRMTAQLRLDVDELLIGRRDPNAGHYPEIDLAHFRHIDGHISRNHARLLRVNGTWYLEDVCENDATFLNDKNHVLNGERVTLSEGDRVLISDSVAMVFRVNR
ncbi:MAG: hypothetical protein ACI82G_003045, partial [Bradymonadia bacterium]